MRCCISIKGAGTRAEGPHAQEGATGNFSGKRMRNPQSCSDLYHVSPGGLRQHLNLAFSLTSLGSTSHCAVRVILWCDAFHPITLQLPSFHCSLLPFNLPPKSSAPTFHHLLPHILDSAVSKLTLAHVMFSTVWAHASLCEWNSSSYPGLSYGNLSYSFKMQRQFHQSPRLNLL